MIPLLQVKNLRTSFFSDGQKVEAVRGISFELYPGEILGIVGESGCGKSVTAKSLLRLIPSVSGKIEEGSVLFQGLDLLAISERILKGIRGNEISMIFQDPLTSLNPTMKVGLQIMEGLCLHRPKLGKKNAYAQVIELLNLIEIPDPKVRFHQYPHELSGGMRQRIMIAIAMICSPKILIADEPTTALDVTIQAQIMDVLKRLQKELEMSMILITHDLSLVASVCDRVLVMYAGKIVEEAPIDILFNAPKHPYTIKLLNSLPKWDENTLTPIRGQPPSLRNPSAGCLFCERCDHVMKLCKVKSPPPFKIREGHFSNCWLFDVKEEV